MTPMETHYFECDCHSDEHMIKFTYDPDDGTVYLSTFLHHYKPWYGRMWDAIKHVLGYKSKYGHFDCTLLSGDKLERLRALCDKAIQAQKDNLVG